MHDLKSLIPYLVRFKGKMLWGAVAIVFSTFLALAQPFLIGNGIDRLRQGNPQEEIFWIVGIILALAAVQGTDLTAMCEQLADNGRRAFALP